MLSKDRLSGRSAARCHIRMNHTSDNTKQPLTIPRHKTLGRGLLRKLLRDAEITIEQLSELI
jgi:hypothetical protein